MSQRPEDPDELGAAETVVDAGGPTLPASEPSSAGFRRGAVLGARYELLEEVGRGAHGAVFRAFDRHAAEEVALKIILEGRGEDLGLLRRELSMARKVTHPGVVRLHDLVEIEGGWALSMALVEGTSLEAEIQRGPLPNARLGEVARALASALAALHEAGVTHRDLKPANILVHRDGKLVVTDFGIARLHAAPAHTAEAEGPSQPGIALTQAGALIGTPLYMAPEQLEGSVSVGPPADIYAYGLIVFEAATGRPLHRATSLAELLELRTKHVGPPVIGDEVPVRLRSVLCQCLARDPADRFPSGQKLLEALEGRRAEPAALSQVETSTVPTLRNRGRWVAAAGAVLALALAVLVARDPLRSKGVGTAPSATSAPPMFIPANVRRITFNGSCDEYPAFFPDGKRLVFDRTEGGKSHLYILDLESKKEELLTRSTGWDIAAAVSPSGDRVAFLRRDDVRVASYILDLDGSREPTLLAAGSVRPSFSSDGSSVWAGEWTSPTRIALSDRTVLERVVPPLGQTAPRLKTLEDGRVVALLRAIEESDRGGLAVREARSGEWSWRWLIENSGRANLMDVFAWDAQRAMGIVSRLRQGAHAEVVGFVPETEATPTLSEATIDAYAGLDVTRDGRTVAWSNCRAQALLAKATSGTLEVVQQDGKWSTRDGVVLVGGAFAFISNRDGVSDKLWVAVSGSSPRVLEMPGVPSGIAASADGKKIVAATDRGLVMLDVAGASPPRAMTNVAFDSGPSIDWRGDVIFSRPGSDGKPAAFRAPAAGGPLEPLGLAGADDVAASPTEDLILYLDAGPEASVPMRLDAGGRRPLAPDLPSAMYRAPAFSPDGKTAVVIKGPNEMVSIDVSSGRVLRSIPTNAEQISRVSVTERGDLYVIDQRWSGSIFLADLQSSP